MENDNKIETLGDNAVIEPVVDTPTEPTPVEETLASPAPKGPNKKGKGGLLIVILLLVVGLFAGWFFFLGGEEMLGLKKEEPKQESKQEQKNEEKEESEKVDIEKLTKEDISEYETLIDQILQIRLDKTELSAKELTNQQILKIGIYKLNNYNEEIKKDQLKKAIVETLGNIEYKDEDYLCPEDNKAIKIYDSESETYKQNTEHGGHGSQYFRLYKYFQDATKNDKDGIISISYKIMYGRYDGISGPGYTIYQNAKDSMSKENVLFDQLIESESEAKKKIDEFYDANKDKFAVTTFTFTKDQSGNYVFKDVVSK